MTSYITDSGNYQLGWFKKVVNKSESILHISTHGGVGIY